MAAVATQESRRRWTDFSDEGIGDFEAEVQVREEMKDISSLDLENVAPVDLKDAHDAISQKALRDGVPSVGSAQHKTGKCKPCAFFHTKGCQNDKACQFCHLCPPGEKARRKRLKEHMCEKLSRGSQSSTRFNPADRQFKSGHLRQASGASTGTSSTQSTCSGQTRFSHSRQSSSCSSSSAISSSLPSSLASSLVGMAEMGDENYRAGHDDSAMAPPAPNTNTISLAQALPVPDQALPQWGSCADQMPTSGAQSNCTGMVQYALVPVSVPMQQQNPGAPIVYACFPQPSQTQMPPGNWCPQAQMQYAQPVFVSNCQTPSAAVGMAPSDVQLQNTSHANMQG